ncbi:MAG: SPOR domain-containing protein [Treponema sp.]|jgi:hypothetical protein|nr:SPOR domain-containing protein [Treponema sp.]
MNRANPAGITTNNDAEQFRTRTSGVAVRLVIVALCTLAAVRPLYAQNSGRTEPAVLQPGNPLGVEIQNLEKALARPGISGAEKHDVLVRLAQLQQLSGNIESAAQNWLSAASLPPEAKSAPDQRDDFALVSGVYCLGAMGEWDKAEAALGPLLSAVRQGRRSVPEAARLHAHYLEACARLWKSSGSDTAAMTALAENPRYAALRPVIYYTLWKAASASSGEHWKARLLTEFPQSPEARIAAGGDAAHPVISASPALMWLFFSGSGGFMSDAPPAAAASPAKPGAVPAPAAAKVLQAGLFSNEANARAQSEKIKSAGFDSAVSRRTVNGTGYWVVIVTPGPDINHTIRELKNAGFNAFPVDK